MTTLYGTYQGSPTQARIYCIYYVSYTADHTQAIFSISFGVQFNGAVSDSVNVWSVSGDCGSASGSNVSYSIPSGGGLHTFRTGETAQKYGDATVSASIDNVEDVGGGKISGTFTLDSGALAPYFSNDNYVADLITETSARFNGYVGAGNGGTLNNVQVQYNTTASATGATTYTKGSYGLSTISPLTSNTVYYARLRIANSTYGWSAWGPWISFKTGAAAPSAPNDTWYIGNISQESADVMGITAPSDGGDPITRMYVNICTSPTFLPSYNEYYISWPSASTIHIPNLIPGTLYYARIFAWNGYGGGAFSAVKSFTTLPGVSVNVGGVWKNAVPYVNVGGIWKPASRFVNVGGIWKQ
jgi:hypothetical protein